MRYAAVLIMAGLPAYAGGLAEQGLTDPVVTPPAKCWLVPGLIPCHDRGQPCPISKGTPEPFKRPDGPVDDPHDPMTPPTHNPPDKPTERQKGNNGLGNGDQTAPGKSLDRNRAENEKRAPGHSSGKPQNPN